MGCCSRESSLPHARGTGGLPTQLEACFSSCIKLSIRLHVTLVKARSKHPSLKSRAEPMGATPRRGTPALHAPSHRPLLCSCRSHFACLALKFLMSLPKHGKDSSWPPCVTVPEPHWSAPDWKQKYSPPGHSGFISDLLATKADKERERLCSVCCLIPVLAWGGGINIHPPLPHWSLLWVQSALTQRAQPQHQAPLQRTQPPRESSHWRRHLHNAVLLKRAAVVACSYSTASKIRSAKQHEGLLLAASIAAAGGHSQQRTQTVQFNNLNNLKAVPGGRCLPHSPAWHRAQSSSFSMKPQQDRFAVWNYLKNKWKRKEGRCQFFPCLISLLLPREKRTCK